MLDLLPASSSHPEFFPRSVIGALVVHLLVVGFDIAATRSVVKATEASHRAEPVLLLMPHSADPLIQGELPRNPRIGPPPERFQHILSLWKARRPFRPSTGAGGRSILATF